MGFISPFFVDVTAIPYTAEGMVQILFLTMVYGCILMYASHMICSGTELLLLVPSLAGVVGSIVLPVLASFPDATLIVFSGIGEGAEERIAVGVGALAGSTVMLLTTPWVVTILTGRVNMVEGEPQYKRPSDAPAGEWSKLTPAGAFKGTGISCGPAIRRNAIVMIITLIPILVIQIPAAVEHCALETDKENGACKSPRIAALVGGLMAMIMLGGYMVFQVYDLRKGTVKTDRIDELRQDALRKHVVSIRGLFPTNFIDRHGKVPLAASNKRFQQYIRPFFNQFDEGRTGLLDYHEFRGLLETLGEKPTSLQAEELCKAVDTDSDGFITFENLCAAVISIIKDPDYLAQMVATGRDMDGKKRRSMARYSMSIAHAVQSIEEGHRGMSEGPIVSGGFLSAPGGGSRNVTMGSSVTIASPYSSQRSNTDSIEDAGYGSGRLDLSLRPNDSSASLGDPALVRLVEGKGEPDMPSFVGSEDMEEEEDVEYPKDLANLAPEEQQKRLIRRAGALMLGGVIIILLFSDPMSEVLATLGAHTGIKPFYIAFVLAPYATNGSVLIGAFVYGSKKTEKTATISFASLIGAACMNNTFCLIGLLFIIYSSSFKWVYSAETISIIFIELVMMIFAVRKVHYWWYSFIVGALFPLSIVLVVALEAIGLD